MAIIIETEGKPFLQVSSLHALETIMPALKREDDYGKTMRGEVIRHLGLEPTQTTLEEIWERDPDSIVNSALHVSRSNNLTGDKDTAELGGLLPYRVEVVKENYKPLGIDPYEHHDGPCRSSEFNAYFKLPAEHRPIFLLGLDEATKPYGLIFAQLERHMSGGDPATILDMAMSEMADDFAELLDTGYRAKKEMGETVDPLVEDLRGIFFRMINGHSLLDILDGLYTIYQHDPAATQAVGLLKENGYPIKGSIEKYRKNTLPLGQIAAIVAQYDTENILDIINRPDRLVRLQMRIKNTGNHEGYIGSVMRVLLVDRDTSFEEVMDNLDKPVNAG